MMSSMTDMRRAPESAAPDLDQAIAEVREDAASTGSGLSGAPRIEDLPPPPAGKTGWPWTTGCAPLPAVMSDGSPWPRITLVTPSFNQAGTLEETLRSVLLQGYPNLQYVVLDGGSNDGSVDIIRRYEKHLTTWRSGPDGGQSAAVQRGIEQADGVLFNWLNSDDFLRPDCLGLVARAFALTDADIVTGCRIMRGESGQEFFGGANWRTAWPGYLVGLPDFPQEATFVRTEAVRAAGGLRTDMHLMFDTEFYVRLLTSCRSIVCIEAPLTTMTVTRQIKTLRVDSRRALEQSLLDDRIGALGVSSRVFRWASRARCERLFVRALQALRPKIDIRRCYFDPLEDRWLVGRLLG